MELNEFISETIRQVLEGVRDAQQGDNIQNVNAKLFDRLELGGNLIQAGRVGTLTRLDFEVLVAAEAKGSGGAKLTVLGIADIGGKGERSVSTSNKISFSVPVLLPNGGDTAAERAKREKADEEQRSLEGLRRLTKGLGG